MGSVGGLRIGIVGCGGQGVVLGKAVQRLASVELVAAADPNEDAARHVAELAAEVSVHRSVADLLANAEVDAVLVATPHDVLAPAALAAIRAGKHVMIEKPMALDEVQAKEIEYAAASAGVTCLVGYSFRYGMARRVHEAFVAGAVGELTALTGSISLPRLDDGWSAERESGGGPLLFVGCHLLDLMLWLAGCDPVRVSAEISYRPESGVDDTSAIQLDLAGGRFAQMLVTQSAAGFSYELQVIGTAGSISLRGRDFEDYQIEVYSSAIEAYREPVVFSAAGGDPIDTMSVPELADFVEAIEQGRPPGVTASDGRRVLRVLDAARESARAGRPAALSEPMLAAN
ncbi:MAG: Gfo/Idh/MocA family oxidoreductase [Microlunatus sp.]